MTAEWRRTGDPCWDMSVPPWLLRFPGTSDAKSFESIWIINGVIWGGQSPKTTSGWAGWKTLSECAATEQRMLRGLAGLRLHFPSRRATFITVLSALFWRELRFVNNNKRAEEIYYLYLSQIYRKYTKRSRWKVSRQHMEPSAAAFSFCQSLEGGFFECDKHKTFIIIVHLKCH